MTLPVLAAVFAVVAAAIVLLVRNTRQREAERAEGYRKAASLRGWQVEPGPATIRYTGRTQGIAWTFEAPLRRIDRRDEVRQTSRWETRDVTAPELIVVWPERGKNLVADLPAVARDLVFRNLAAVLGVDAEALPNAKSDPAIAAAIFGTQVVAVTLSPAGLAMIVHTVVNDPAEVEKIVWTGVQLARTRAREGVF